MAYLRYHHGDDQDYFTVTAMAYSGTMELPPTRCPSARSTAGMIDRFGSLNPTDGGELEPLESLIQPRANVPTPIRMQFSAYVIRYQLDLWSTFTYYLKDPVNGDQMLQHDDRVVYGFKGSKTWSHRWPRCR